MFLFEKYHVSNIFDDSLLEIAGRITNYAKAIDSDDGLQWLKQNIGIYRYMNYNVIFKNENQQFIITKFDNPDNDGYPIYIKLFSEDNGWLMSTVMENVNKKHSIVINCNLLNLYHSLTFEINKWFEDAKAKNNSNYNIDDFNEQMAENDYIQCLSAKIAHELNGHAVQLLKKPTISYSNKIDEELEIDINKLPYNADYKENIKKYFYYIRPVEIEVRINEIDAIIHVKGMDILNDIKETHHFRKMFISLDIIKLMLPYIKKNTKYDEIDGILNFLYAHHLMADIIKLNGKYHYFKTAEPGDAVIEYKRKVLKQIYKVLSEDLKIQETDFIKFSIEQKQKNGISVDECFNPVNVPFSYIE